jgi:NADH dehydrogenase
VNRGGVVITGATGQVGRETIDALLRHGIKPTALVRGSEQLEGCITISDWLNSNSAVTAIKHAQTVVHLAGTLNSTNHDYESTNIVPTQRVASAITPARTRRLIFLSYVGASESSANRYLATKARAERLLRETGVPLTVFRCTHIIGAPGNPGPTAASFLARGKKSVTVLGSGKQRVAPIYIGDVVAAIEAAILSGHAGTFDLQGPTQMSFDEFVHLLNGTAMISISHVPRVFTPLLKFVGPKPPGPLIDVMVNDCRSDHPTAQPVFGLSLTPLDRVWLRAD